MKRRIPISRRLLTVLVATLYLATSSTALLHALAHVPAIERSCGSQAEPKDSRAESDDSRAESDRVPASAAAARTCDGVDASAELSAAECFFCHHGPAAAVAAAPAALPSPSLLPASIAPVPAAQGHSALRTPRPSLRAPPFRS